MLSGNRGSTDTSQYSTGFAGVHKGFADGRDDFGNLVVTIFQRRCHQNETGKGLQLQAGRNGRSMATMPLPCKEYGL